MVLDLSQLAARQLRDYDAHQPGAIFADEASSNQLPLSVEQAYAIQAAVVRLREQRGEAVVGYKIGCTSPVIQQQLGIGHPVFGRLFATERFPSGVALSVGRFEKPAIEGELAVRLSKDVPPHCAEPERLRASIGNVFPVIELHNHVFRSANQAACELIANNALHAGFVVPSSDLEPPLSDDLTLRIDLDGATVAEVACADWRDSVTRSIAELSRLLAEHSLSLRAGDVALTGSRAALFPVAAGSCVEVTMLGHGGVSARFH